MDSADDDDGNVNRGQRYFSVRYAYGSQHLFFLGVGEMGKRSRLAIVCGWGVGFGVRLS